MPTVTPDPLAPDLLSERLAGDSLRVIGARQDLHHEIVRRIVLAEGEQVVADLERDLENGERPVILIPWGQDLTCYRDALVMFDWSVRQLHERGHAVAIRTCRSNVGAAFKLTLEGSP